MSDETREYTENNLPDPDDYPVGTGVIDISELREESELPTQEELLQQRIQERRRRIKRKERRRKRLILLGIILALVLALTMCGREIIRLKAENASLKKQQAELKEERDRLTEELKSAGSKEYIKEQARKQLRLLDPGEIMFIFDEDGDGKNDK